MVEHERVLRGSTSRTMAAISLGFIVIVTPYTIQEVVAACTGSKVIIVLLLFAVVAGNEWTKVGVAGSALNTAKIDKKLPGKTFLFHLDSRKQWRS